MRSCSVPTRSRSPITGFRPRWWAAPRSRTSRATALQLAKDSENGLPDDYYRYLVSGGTGLAPKTADIRIDHAQSLPAGPFQLTNGKTFTYDDYAASPAHRFYQMWQQLDCNVGHATAERPSGCDAQLVRLGRGDGGRRLRRPAARAELQHPTTRPARRPRARVPRRSASTTCSTAMRRISRASPINSR